MGGKGPTASGSGIIRLTINAQRLLSVAVSGTVPVVSADPQRGKTRKIEHSLFTVGNAMLMERHVFDKARELSPGEGSYSSISSPNVKVWRGGNKRKRETDAKRTSIRSAEGDRR